MFLSLLKFSYGTLNWQYKNQDHGSKIEASCPLTTHYLQQHMPHLKCFLTLPFIIEGECHPLSLRSFILLNLAIEKLIIAKRLEKPHQFERFQEQQAKRLISPLCAR